MGAVRRTGVSTNWVIGAAGGQLWAMMVGSGVPGSRERLETCRTKESLRGGAVGVRTSPQGEHSGVHITRFRRRGGVLCRKAFVENLNVGGGPMKV